MADIVSRNTEKSREKEEYIPDTDREKVPRLEGLFGAKRWKVAFELNS